MKSSFKLLKNNRFKIVKLTDSPIQNFIKLIEKNDLYSFVDKSFSIEEERVWKPNQLPYQNVMKFFKLRPNQGIIIACHE